MRELEERFTDELVVIGVHSGKYHAERITQRIRDASIRLGVGHPIVNDRQFRIWRSYAVSAWPTLVMINPEGYVVGAGAGEFTSESLAPFITSLIQEKEAKGTLKQGAMTVVADPPTVAPGRLRYPGKVAVQGSRIAIADSGNHRVLTGTLSTDGQSMTVELVVGRGKRGYDGGSNASFNSPQGMAFADRTLYVADAGNHAVRAIDLGSGGVSTVAGTGRQLRTHADREGGALSSPWDLELKGESMYIAMAGVHQIWALDLATGRLRIHTGTGGEDIRDGSNPDALLAQPMGITSTDDRLYFADSESSAIRWSELGEDGETGTVLGTGLFDFGDVDGKGDEIRMQHQQGVDLSPDGRLLVADSYNDVLKWVDPVSRSAVSWVRGLSEPGGVACGAQHAYVADTNAHRILTVS
ncbi:MAG: alkyl hydroperoxide reductase, partial [Gemmatimonadota bacterium]|nr:alkyl hydroperoxide reductase [Gemmatimonadota bacterium]